MDGDVVMKPLVDVASEEVAMVLKRKEKVKENVVDIAKSYPKPLPPFPQRLVDQSFYAKIDKYIEKLNKLALRVPFIDALKEMLGFVKYLKDFLKKKRLIEDVVSITHRVSAIIADTHMEKIKDRGEFVILCTIGQYDYLKSLCNMGKVST